MHHDLVQQAEAGEEARELRLAHAQRQPAHKEGMKLLLRCCRHAAATLLLLLILRAALGLPA